MNTTESPAPNMLSADQQFPPPGTTPAGTTSLGHSETAAGSAPRPPRSGWRVATGVLGAMALIPAVGMLIGGTVLTVATTAGTDDGFLDVTEQVVESEGAAVTVLDIWDDADDAGQGWAADWVDLEVRIEAEPAAGSEVFVGIARTADIERYLAEVSYSEATDIDDDLVYELHNVGSVSALPAPTDEQFWVESAERMQDIVWTAREGDWSVVIMNADGSPGVEAYVDVDVASDAFTAFSVMLLVLGAVGTAVATGMLIFGIRRPRR